MRLWPTLSALPLLALLALPAAGAEVLPASDETLTTAFSAIQDRALNPVEIGPLAFDGLRALSTIDPAIEVEKTSSHRIGLEHAGRLVAQYPVPSLNDTNGWASLTVRLTQAAKRVSPLVRDAGDEQIRMTVIDAAMSHLDRFSRYAPPGEADEQRANRNGFGGIGVRLEPHETDVTLTEVLPNTPASKAHLKAGDHILAIDGKPVGGLTQETVSHLMRGPVASTIQLTVRQPDQQQASVISLVRDHISPPTVRLDAPQDGISTIALTGFTESSDDEMFRALSSLSGNAELKGLVLDLRGNPGGLLDKAVNIADLFMAEGRIVSTKGRHPDSLQTYDAQAGDLGEKIPLVVLVDGRTASAAEILAAALQDSGRAVIIGSNSYGKGTVQTVLTLPNKAELTLTWSRYYAPSGYSLHDLGVLPTLCSEGAKTPEEGASLLHSLDDPQTTLPASLAAWRTVPVEQIELRKRLRQSCPAENRLSDAANDKFDKTLARQLLADQRLYAKALALGAMGKMQNLGEDTTSSP